MKVGVIGYGLIAKEVIRSVTERGWEIGPTARTSGIYDLKERKIDELSNWLEHFKRVDIACLCISTLDDGKAAYEYIKELVGNGIPVVTCEKGAVGNYFIEIEPLQSKIGLRATVGGKTGMALELRSRVNSKTRGIYAVLNATLNYMFSEVGRGRLFGQAAGKARKLGFADPGAFNPLEIINNESTRDIPMKVAILYNVGLGGRYGPLIRAKDISARPIRGDELDRLFEEADERRYIVSITKEERNREDIIGGFIHQVGQWTIIGGFREKSKCPLFRWLNPIGEDNALAIYDDGEAGRVGLIGEGAGPEPTVSSIIRDIEELLIL